MLPQKVIFKGIRDGIMVIIDASAGVDELLSSLAEHARLGKDFFAGSVALIEMKDGELSPKDTETITRFLVSEMGFGEVRPNTVQLHSNPVTAGSAQMENTNEMVQDSAFSAPSADATLFVKRTLRSGQKVNYVGHVVVMGDVNPGAEIVAGGDIIVLGALRGVAHAGATGNDSTSVFSLKLQPTQLRIANFIARPPDGDNRVPTAPEVACIKEGQLVIETYAVGNRG